MAIEKIEGSKVKITFEVTSEKFEEALDNAFNVEKEKINVKGFRKGQVPRGKYEKEFGVESLYQEAIMQLADELYAKAIQENNLLVVGNPEIDLDYKKIKRGENFDFSIIAPIFPEVKLGEYKNLEAKKINAEATEEEIEKEIEEIKKQNVIVIPKENGTLQNKDIAIFDFKGTKDGVAFEGGSAENYELEIGSGQFIPGFEEQMIDMKQGDEKTINVTFPEEYQAADLAGKEVQFEIKLHEIKCKELPELNDDFVKELNNPDAKTVEELKTFVKNNLECKKANSEKNRLADELVEQVSNNATLEIPQTMIDSAVKDELDNFEKTIQQQYGMKFDDFKQIAQINEDEFMNNLKEKAVKRLKETIVLEAVIKEENITVTDEELEKTFQEIAEANNMNIEEVKKKINKNDIQFNVSINKVIDYLIENAKLQ